MSLTQSTIEKSTGITPPPPPPLAPPTSMYLRPNTESTEMSHPLSSTSLNRSSRYNDEQLDEIDLNEQKENQKHETPKNQNIQSRNYNVDLNNSISNILAKDEETSNAPIISKAIPSKITFNNLNAFIYSTLLPVVGCALLFLGFILYLSGYIVVGSAIVSEYPTFSYSSMRYYPHMIAGLILVPLLFCLGGPLIALQSIGSIVIESKAMKIQSIWKKADQQLKKSYSGKLKFGLMSIMYLTVVIQVLILSYFIYQIFAYHSYAAAKTCNAYSPDNGQLIVLASICDRVTRGYTLCTVGLFMFILAMSLWTSSVFIGITHLMSELKMKKWQKVNLYEIKDIEMMGMSKENLEQRGTSSA